MVGLAILRFNLTMVDTSYAELLSKGAMGVIETLEYLHNNEGHYVIHRDIKSSNVQLSEDFEPQHFDFGLAKWASTSSLHIICTDVAGTFGYMAPEYFMYEVGLKKILDLMNVPWLTRENVASHLQKFGGERKETLLPNFCFPYKLEQRFSNQDFIAGVILDTETNEAHLECAHNCVHHDFMRRRHRSHREHSHLFGILFAHSTKINNKIL
ncbi:Receptor-like cytosolic serine/threonine-protein kinase RBK1, partial [Mucuna pruriens]